MPVLSETGMELTRLVVLELAPGEVHRFACGDAEWIVLPLSGACEVRCAAASPAPGGAPGAGPAPDPGPGRAPGGAPDTEPVPAPGPGARPGSSPPRPSSVPRGSAPDPAPQTPAGLGEWGSAPDLASRASAGLGERGSAPDPAPRASAEGGVPEGGRGVAVVSGRGGVGEGSAGTFRLRGRASVFDGPSDFVYLPRDAHADVASAAGGRFALVGARCERRLAPRYGPADAVPVELRGAGSCSRQVHNFAAADAFACDRLIAVEVLTPGGNWSSYPPHKHDEHHPGEESRLEEIYFYEIAPHGTTPGVGYQRVTPSPAGKTDVLAEVRSGDVVLIPDGWHGPSIAAPGHDMYYLNVMAGPDAEREWLIRDHPDHAWIRATWRGRPTDPRLPFPRTPEETP